MTGYSGITPESAPLMRQHAVQVWVPRHAIGSCKESDKIVPLRFLCIRIRSRGPVVSNLHEPGSRVHGSRTLGVTVSGQDDSLLGPGRCRQGSVVSSRLSWSNAPVSGHAGHPFQTRGIPHRKLDFVGVEILDGRRRLQLDHQRQSSILSWP